MPRCGHVSRMAKYFPAAVRPSTSGMPSSMAVAMRLPPTSDERSAGYQSSYSKLAVGPEAATCARVTSPIMGVQLHTIAEPYCRPASWLKIDEAINNGPARRFISKAAFARRYGFEGPSLHSSPGVVIYVTAEWFMGTKYFHSI